MKLVMWWLVGLLVILLAACEGGGLSSAPGGDFGATPGGVQDMGLARELVDNGLVPPPEAFTVEGMFSEHDLPLEGESCERLLCLRGAVGVAPTLDEAPAAWFQVGLSSTINPATFERPPLSLVFVVDVSGSMDWQYETADNEYQTPLKVAKLLMEKLVPTLGGEDEVGIVIYGSRSKTVLDLTPGSEQPKVLSAVRALESEGSTNMEEGLQTAYRLIQGARSGNEKRLLLFTDVQPNVGATEATEFQNLVKEGASGGVGLSVFGVGVGLGPETFDAMSRVRGGNAFTLFGGQEVDKVLAEDWPFLASPIAYDLTLSLTPSAGLEVAEGYGFPTDDGEAELSTSTVFLSKRRGALLVQLNLEDVAPFDVAADLTYRTPGGELSEDSLLARYAGEELNEGRYFAQPSVGRTVALALLVDAMKRAATLYGTNQEEATQLLKKATGRFAQDVGDELAAETQFAQALLALMEAGAEQGTLYGR